MPPGKPRPSEIAAEAKKYYFNYIENEMQEQVYSAFYPDSSAIRLPQGIERTSHLRVAVIDGDPVDVALDWQDSNKDTPSKDPVTGQILPDEVVIISPANEKRPGGDWDSGLMAPEECLCRRSNLVRNLVKPGTPSHPYPNYPIPQKGGLFSPRVVIFRDGPDRYEPWQPQAFKALGVISVAPVRRPKLDESGTQYSFVQEKDLMQEKMRTALRIAAKHKVTNLCMGAFGVGPGFRNPSKEVAEMWREVLFFEPEFLGLFSNVVFAIEDRPAGSGKGGVTDFEIFRRAFSPHNCIPRSFT